MDYPFYCETATYGNGSSQPKKGKYSYMSDSTKLNQVQSQKDPPSQEIPKIIPETQEVLSDDDDYESQLKDEYMEINWCEVFVSERDGEVSVRYCVQIKAIVKENAYFESVTGLELHHNFWEIESPEDMKI
ncbi:MAG: hypothetical protein EZS28_004513 [Streblomastix strix]|uniref:Uncharacterized protein n=1 Tax=Streblomastix strix TaxID=222440 RepID=A0A5J4WZP4_9EUKA|nr:MAG: hypothetical protein EZS28_004513 [Streblomastix strix]